LQPALVVLDLMLFERFYQVDKSRAGKGRGGTNTLVRPWGWPLPSKLLKPMEAQLASRACKVLEPSSLLACQL